MSTRTRPDQAARIWRELATGQWLVVEASDERGMRRLTLARTGRRPLLDWSRLTRCERRIVDLASRGTPQKVIALELRCSRSSVSEALRRIRDRLGFAHAGDLARAYGVTNAPDVAVEPAGEGR
jgi:DNA-binding CsgD family transcriptional regulator